MLRDRELRRRARTPRGDAEVPFPESLQALIAARLDTLAAGAQGAAAGRGGDREGVLGRCGRGDGRPRPRATCERALHELGPQGARAPVRGARRWRGRPSTASGTRSSATSPTGRSRVPQRAGEARARRRTGSSSKAGERVEDVAEVLAYHAGEALELAEATGDAELAAEVGPAARRYALLAGERALGLDVTKALLLLERALEHDTGGRSGVPLGTRRLVTSCVPVG